VTSPVADLQSDFGVDSMSCSLTFRHRFGEINFAMNELMSEKVNIALRVSESLSDNFSRKSAIILAERRSTKEARKAS